MRFKKRKNQPEKDLQKLDSDLNKPEYAKKVVQNVQVKRQGGIIKTQSKRFEKELKNAEGTKRANILKILENLRKAEKINKTAFFKK